MQNASETIADTASDRLVRNEMVQQVNEALVQLPQKYRQVLELCFLDGLTQKEAAAILGKPVGTIAWRVQQGLERLKAILTRRGVGAVVIASLPGLFAQQAEAASPVAASLWADAALAAAEGADTSAKLGLLGFLSYRGWAAVLLSTVLLSGGGAAAWWISTNTNEAESQAVKPIFEAVVEETLQRKNLRILNQQVLPKLLEALKPFAPGNGEIVVLAREAHDHHVDCVLEVRTSLGGKGTRFEFEYDTLGAELDLRVDFFGRGKCEPVDPNRPIILWRNPFTGKDVIIPIAAMKNAEKTFEVIPLDVRAFEERTTLWKKQVQEDGREGLFPGPIISWAGNLKHLYVTTVGNWLWRGNIQGPDRQWECIGRGANWALAANEDSLFTESNRQILTRPADGIALEWQPLCGIQTEQIKLAATQQYLFYLSNEFNLYGRRSDDRTGPWASMGKAPGGLLLASASWLYSETNLVLSVRSADLTPAPWNVTGARPPKPVEMIAGGRLWSGLSVDASLDCWSTLDDEGVASWRREGPVVNVRREWPGTRVREP
jgi:hypothetical protein